MQERAPDNSRFKSIILFGGAALIALSLALFVSAVTSGDFVSGRPGAFLVASFALLVGLALFLLIVVFRTMNAPAKTPGRKKAAQEGAATAATAETRPETSVQLLSDTAGELRTSVDVIQEELEELIDDEVPVDKEHMQSLYEETGRLKKIIDGMEQLSQAQALARALRKTPIQLEPLLKGIIEKTRGAARNKKITFNLECEPGLTLTADADCLGRIIGNIADNAAKAVQDTGSVSLSAARKGDLVVFSVADTGAGISRKQVSHIFERFFRGAGSGVGMGLAIVKELVDACGGKITVQTRAGEGTTFTVQMPVS